MPNSDACACLRRQSSFRFDGVEPPYGLPPRPQGLFKKKITILTCPGHRYLVVVPGFPLLHCTHCGHTIALPT